MHVNVHDGMYNANNDVGSYSFVFIMQNFKVPLSESAEDNIEENLLRPAGVMLKPASYIVRIYKAEELPRSMSETQRQHVKEYDCN